MTLKVSQRLIDLISELTKTIISSREHNIESIKKKFDDILTRLTSTTQMEAQKYIDSANPDEAAPDEAAKLYYLLSKAQSRIADLIQDKELSNLLYSNAASWLSYADQAFTIAISYYTDKALKYEKYNKYKKSTEYKNIAKTLEYTSIKKKEILDQEITDFLEQFLSSRLLNKSENIQKTRYVEPLVTVKGRQIITPDQINIKNSKEESKTKGHGWYDWSIYLDNGNSILDQIGHVIYTLHPSFLEYESKVTDPTKGFRLNATGWGEFEIKVDVCLKDGDIITKYHWLDLGLNSKI